MPNWFESMQQTYKYFKVNPNTWSDEEEIRNVTGSTIMWNNDSDTLGSATIDTTEKLGECYVRIYLVTIQNGVEESTPLGTFLVQTPSSNVDGKTNNISADAYTPLLELKEKYPDIGFYIPKKTNVMDEAYNLMVHNRLLRAPVTKASCEDELNANFVADLEDNWLVFLEELISNAKYIFKLDEMGNVYFAPKQDIAALTPVVTFEPNDISILYPEVSADEDLYGIPNVVEVVCSNQNSEIFRSVIENVDPDSPTSIINRGRKIMHRETNPNITGTATQERVDEYARLLLQELSSVEHTITFTHGYYPVRVGDCVRINYPQAKLDNVKAMIISQSIKCEPGCPVTSKAVYTTKYWRVNDDYIQ